MSVTPAATQMFVFDGSEITGPVAPEPREAYRVRIPRDGDQRSELMSITIPK
jgi:hypothetical protein